MPRTTGRFLAALATAGLFLAAPAPAQPTHPSQLLVLAEVTSPPPNDSAAAVAAWHAGRLAEAASLLESAASASPHPARLWLARAQLDLDFDDPATYASHLERAARAAQTSGDADAEIDAGLKRIELLSALGSPWSAARILAAMPQGATTAQKARLLIERARLEVGRGRLDLAEVTLKSAAAIAGSGGAAPELLQVMELQAGAASLRNHFDDATALDQQILALARRVPGSSQGAQAAIQMGREALHNRDAAAARAYARQALAFGLPANSVIEAEAALIRGTGFLIEGKRSSARAELLLAVRMARWNSEDLVQSAAEVALGDCDAIDRNRDQAIRWYSRASASLDRSEGARWKQPYNPSPPWVGARALLRRQLNLALWDKAPERSWQIQEDDRTRALLRAISGSATNRLMRWKDSEMAQARKLAEARALLRAQPAATDSAWDAFMESRDALERDVRNRFQGEYHLQAAHPDEMKRALPAGTALVGYFFSPTIPCAYVMTSESLTLVPLGSEQDLTQALSGALGGSRRGPGMSADSSAQILRQKLNQAVARRIPDDVHRLILVPDGQLMYLARYLPGASGGSDESRQVAWAASAGSWLWFQQHHTSLNPRRNWMVIPTVSAGDTTQLAEHWRGLLGPSGAVLEPGGLDVEDLFDAAAGSAVLLYLPGAQISDRRPDQSRLLPPGKAARDTSWMDLQAIATSRLPVANLVVPQQRDPSEREGSGLGSLGLAYATLLAGPRRLILQTGGAAQGDLLEAWMSAFEASLKAGRPAAEATATATRAVRERFPDAAPADVPQFAVFGAAFDPVAFQGPTLVEPWILGFIAVSAILALGYLIRALLKRRVPKAA